MDLGLFFIQQTDELVVLLDGFERLDKDGLAGGGAAVNDAGDAALELGFDGDDETLAADGDEVLVRGLGGTLFAQGTGGAAEGGLDGAVLLFHGPADAAKLGAGVVRERAIGLDFAAQGAEKAGERRGEAANGGSKASPGV